MFSKLALFVAASMAVFVAAAPTPGGAPGGIENSCNTGPVQCCNSLQNSNTPSITTLLGLLGVVVGGVTGQVGVQCSPLSVIGAGGNSCTSQPVCCENNSFNGLIAIGCSPININL